MSLGIPNTVLNTIVAEAIDEMVDKVEAAKAKGKKRDDAVLEVVKAVWKKHKRIVFGGDNYADAWHKEAEKRGLANLRTTPDALPWLVEKQTIRLFERYDVLSRARARVALRGLGRAVRDEAQHRGRDGGVDRPHDDPAGGRSPPRRAQVRGPDAAGDGGEGRDRQVRQEPQGAREGQRPHPAVEGLEHAKYMRDKVIPAMDATRDAADELERIVADDLWPLPKYSEMLFIK